MEARDHELDDPSGVVGALRALHGRPGEGASFVERVRLTLWLAGVIMLAAGALSAVALGGPRPDRAAGAGHRSPPRARSMA
jgi:hypothetical protein